MPVIEVTELVKRYAGRNVVDGVSLSVEEGEIFGILGPNGAGKTTTVEIIEGLRTADAGTVRVTGLDPRRDRDELRRRLGAQLQASRLPAKLRVAEALALYASFTTTRATWDLIEQIRDSGVTILLVTHFMDEAERLSDRLAILDDGRIVALDTPVGLVAQVDTEQRMRFRPSAPVPDDLLGDLPGVSGVAARRGAVVVTGGTEIVHEVTAALARAEIVAHDLRIEQPGLDEAFVTLTGRRPQD